MLTAHPDVEGDLRRLRAADPRRHPGDQERGPQADGILLVGFDALPDEVKQIQAGNEDGVGRAVPRQDG